MNSVTMMAGTPDETKPSNQKNQAQSLNKKILNYLYF